MTWNICFFASIAVLIAGVIWAVCLFRQKNKQNNDTLGFFVMAATVFVSAAVMFFAFALSNDYDGVTGGGINSVFLAVRKAIGIFVVDGDFAFFAENMEGMLPGLQPFASAWMSILVIAAPLFTFGFLLSFFKNLSSRIRFSIKRNADVYVFSELNEKSLVLANDLKKNDAKRVIVFCDVFENDDERFGELLAAAKKIDAIFFEQDILDISFDKHTKRGLLYFFITGTDETENVNQALGLIARYGHYKNGHLYLFSDSISGEVLLFSGKKTEMRIHRVNESLAMIHNALYQDPTVVFENTSGVTPEGDKVISAVLVGLGGYGMESLKTLVWYGQMDGYRVKINAFDKDELAEDRVAFLCPEVMDGKYNHVYVPGEACYGVDVHSDVEVGTKKFADHIAQLKDASFVLVSLGNDDLNIQTAVSLRIMFERLHIHPTIYAVVYNDQLAECLQDLTNYKGQPYNIRTIGGLKASYSENVILHSALEKDALAIHLAYGDTEQNFYAHEYNYNSSTASALHNRARAKLQVNGAHLPIEQRSEAQLKKLDDLEHRRWNAYMRSIGYVHANARNDLGKMHHNLSNFKDLTLEDILKDRRVASVRFDT
ncbi:MAG: hypothetical protein IIX86_05730 [Clostridia bacterium]|nr:hypothetical protein [Clostridia bacterium]